MRGKNHIFILLTAIIVSILAGCGYSSVISDKIPGEEESDSLHFLKTYHYTIGTNFIVHSDFLLLAQWPIKDDFVSVPHNSHLVVADFKIHPNDFKDSIWVKVACSQEVMGWVRESYLLENCIPVDIISQAIYLFSHTHLSWFIALLVIFTVLWVIRISMRRRLPMVYFNDIDSIYPLSLCLLMAIAATIYESIQVIDPETWKNFYFNPTLSPFKVPFVLGCFLGSLWLFVIIFLSVIDDVFSKLSIGASLFYLLGLGSACIFCYFFFIWTTYIYIGYIFLIGFLYLFYLKLKDSLRYKYRCGKCGAKLLKKGICPHCGSLNE